MINSILPPCVTRRRIAQTVQQPIEYIDRIRWVRLLLSYHDRLMAERDWHDAEYPRSYEHYGHLHREMCDVRRCAEMFS